MARSIAGLFENRQSAEQAITDLKGAGFDPSRIGVVMQDKQETRDFAQEHGTASTEGAVAGGVIGGTAGALLAATGALVIPGIGPFVSGGILASLVGGAAGWLVGGLTGLGIPKDEAEYYEDRVQRGSILVTVDAQERDAEARQILLRDGAEDLQSRGFGGGYDDGAPSPAMNTAPSMAGTATMREQPASGDRVILNDASGSDDRVTIVGGQSAPAGERATTVNQAPMGTQVNSPTGDQVNLAGGQMASDDRVTIVDQAPERLQTGTMASAAPVTTGTTANVTETEADSVPLMAEELTARTRQEEIGEVHLHKGVVEEQQTIDVPVQREQVTVDRVPARGDTAAPGAQGAFQEQDIRVPVMGEEAVAEKQARVVEEVRLHKDTVTESQPVTDTVRREDVRLEGANDQAQGYGTGQTIRTDDTVR